MTEPLRLSNLIEACLPDYAQTHPLNPRQWQVCHHVLDCRTERIGETRLRCQHCTGETSFFHACRDRHCPRCQRQASEAWCARQCENTLNVTYYHVVFTLPSAINPLVELHPEGVYAQLFDSVWATLADFAADPKRLNGQLGATLFLHTWGQTLTRHLHVHCLVPGGALNEAGTWKQARSTYLFPVRALSRYFRGHFVRSLRERHRRGEFHRLQDPGTLTRMLDALMEKNWVVYCKPCLKRPETVLEYLARYTHRTALADTRLVGWHEDKVQLRYKDYRDERYKIMHLDPEELLRRFLLHVLPKGFMRIRHYGFLANRCRVKKLAEIRAARAKPNADTDASKVRENNFPRCPHCGQGPLVLVERRLPAKRFATNTRPRSPTPMN
jgi:hypothetical protein